VTRVLHALSAALLCAMTSSAVAAQALTPIRVPADPNAAVIVMDRIGGLTPRQNASPDLTVRSNGWVVAVETGLPDKVFTAQLSAEELQELLHFVIDDQSFFQISASDVQKQIDAENDRRGHVIKVDDLSTPVIRVTTAERSYEVSINGPSQWLRWYPSIRPLAQLAAVEKRLTRLKEEVMVGWLDGLEAVLEVANRYLKRDPSLPTLARTDYQRTLYSDAGQRTVYFERSPLSVSVSYPPYAEPQVSVRLAGTLLTLEPR